MKSRGFRPQLTQMPRSLEGGPGSAAAARSRQRRQAQVFWRFEPSEGHNHTTLEEQHKEFLAKLVTWLVYTCNHLQSEVANLGRSVRNHNDLHEDATWALHSRVQNLEQAAPGPDGGEPSNATSTRQLEQRVDHVVAMLGDINTFAAPATISEQLDTLKTEVRQLHQLPDNDGNTSASWAYKTLMFRIEKFDDYTHQDPVTWWQGFTTEIEIHEVPNHLCISTLFLNAKGGCQIWLSHMATIHGVQVFDLHKKISWDDMTKEWKKRFIVDDAPTLAINRLFAMTQGNTPTRDWLTEWQKIVATPDLELSFSHMHREFYNRSCAALSLALVRAPLMNVGVEVVDLHDYVAKIAHEFKTQRRSLDEHEEHLHTVLERLRQANYNANRDKCEFTGQELEYLGHFVTPQGLHPLADKIDAIRVWPEPTNTTEVRSFMGLAGYYQRFITGYSRSAAPLTRLQSPKVPFVFSDEAPRSFQALKAAMLMAPVLSIYDPTLPTRVTTDTSSYGIRAVLEQHDGQDPMWLLGDTEARARQAGERFANKGWDTVTNRVVMGGWKEFKPLGTRTKIWVPEFVADWFGGFEHVTEVVNTMERTHVDCAWLAEEFYRTSLKFGPFHGDRAREEISQSKMAMRRARMSRRPTYPRPPTESGGGWEVSLPASYMVRGLDTEWMAVTLGRDQAFMMVECLWDAAVKVADNQLKQLDARIATLEARPPQAAPGCTPDMTDTTKQLNGRIDHVGDIGVFNGPDTISSTVAAIKTNITKLQTKRDAATKSYKMPHFDISKFDDHNKTDALAWWQRFLTEASCCTVPDDYMMKALYLQLIGGAQAWMNHLAATHTCTIAELHTHITWKEFEQLWFTRFMVRNVVKAAMNEVYTCSQGNMPTRDWTTKWQKIVTTPGFDLTFPNQRSEFFSRSCAGLRSTLGNEYDYTSFQAILDRANLVIQTDDKAASEKQSQPHYVAKQGYQLPAHNNAVISKETDDLHAAAESSSDGGIVAALQPKRPKRVRKPKARQETASTGTGQQPWTAYNIQRKSMNFVRSIRPLADKIQAIVDWPEPRYIDVPCSPAFVPKYRDLLIKARANMQKAQIRMQQQANRRRLPCPFPEGDLVWVLSEEFALEQDVSRKLLSKWFGPWEVTSAVGDDPASPSFVINIPPHLTVHWVFHTSKLAIYTPPIADEFPGRRSQDPPSMDGHQEVDRVITHRKYGNKPMQYKVTFKQCAPDDTRWISSADLQTSAPLIFANYEKTRLGQTTPPSQVARLLKKEAILKWDQDCTLALKKLKRALREYPILKVADPSLPFVVTTDVSQYGIGVVLQQDDGNGYRPVEFMSARLSSEKVATYTYERELYALRSINPSRTLLATGGGDPDDVAIFLLPSFEPMSLLSKHEDWIFASDWVSDKVLATCSRDTSVKLWCVQEERDCFVVDEPVVSKVEHKDKVRDLKYSPTTDRLVSLSQDETCKIWDPHVMEVVHTVRLSYKKELVCLAVEAPLIAVGSQRHITLVDMRCSHEASHINSKDENNDLRVHRSVIGELDVGKPVNPIFLVGTDERTQHHLSGLVRSLRVAIRLRVASRARLHCRTGSPKGRHEASISVAHYVFRNTLVGNPTGVQESCELRCCSMILARKEASILAQTVNDRENAVMVVAIAGERACYVHSNGEARCPRNRQWFQFAEGDSRSTLVAVANCA
ncbi:hypothetical protein CBR_g25735 [Chara braunii]|uniref:Uncharacterized protein n=1 Tax=Chara braunii TaxID=69332 RepID=A0A388L692_CHABU|nr:hypothetical protein CBR_g25735 [Chara braunii]|eukprot:GBG77804.1 hypothetical protein CBR_g25735 [Chara braunii]